MDFQLKTVCGGVLNSVISNLHEAMLGLTFYKIFLDWNKIWSPSETKINL